MLEFLASKRLFLVHLTLILLSAWLVFNWYGAVQRLIASYLPVPQMDYWRVVVDYRASALAFPFLLQWTLTQLAAILSLAFLTSARRSSGRTRCVVRIRKSPDAELKFGTAR